MGEIKTNDIQEMNAPAIGGYREIKPQEGTSLSDAKASWDSEFNNIANKQTEFENSSEKEYLDDNGKLYRKGNELAPNSEFVVNGYKYNTDELGRTVSAEGTLRIRDADYEYTIASNQAVYKGDKPEGYERGHLIGYQFGGSGGIENLSVMAGEVNHGDFLNLETKLANAVKDGSDVKMKVEPIFENSSNKPTEYKVTYSINGEKDIVVFGNRNEADNDK